MILEVHNTIKIDNDKFPTIEEYYGFSVDESIKSIIRNFNGRVVNQNGKSPLLSYKLDDGSEMNDVIEAVFDENEIIEQLEYINYLEQFKEHFELDDSYVECNTLLPLMELGSGVLYISISGVNKGVLYAVDNGYFGITKLPTLLNQISFRVVKTA